MSLRELFDAGAIERNYPTYPAWDGEPPHTAPYAVYHQYKWMFWWGFVRNIFNRPELPATHYPRPESMRAGRSHQGGLRVIPINYLDDVVIPGDLTEEDKKQFCLTKPINVQLPVSGPPIVSRADAPTVLKARALGFGEIAVRVYYV